MSKEKQKLEEIKKPIETTGLSIETIYMLKRLGCNSIKDFIGSEPVDHMSIYNKINNASKILKVEPEKCQHSYIELLEYLKYYKIKFRKPKRHDLTGQIEQEQYEELFQNIKSKLIQYHKIRNRETEECLDNIITEIIDITKPQIIELDDIETRIIRIMCGIYTKGKEQTFEQTIQFLKSKGINIEENKAGLIFYNALNKIKTFLESNNKNAEKTIRR